MWRSTAPSGSGSYSELRAGADKLPVGHGQTGSGWNVAAAVLTVAALVSWFVLQSPADSPDQNVFGLYRGRSFIACAVLTYVALLVLLGRILRADEVSPVNALALYFDFRELTPVGDEGDTMIRQLADRLVEVDLLGRAAQLIQHQVTFRLKGDEKARVGTKLAAIYILDRQYDKAMGPAPAQRW